MLDGTYKNLHDNSLCNRNSIHNLRKQFNEIENVILKKLKHVFCSVT